VAAIAGDREERDLIAEVLFGHLHDAGDVRYRQEVFQDLEHPALFDEVQRFARLMGEVRTDLRQLAKMEYRYHREGWLLDAAAIYCDAVQSLAGHLASAQISSRALLAFREYLASYVASAGFTALASDTSNRKDALGQIRYCTRIRGGRVDVSRYQEEADYSTTVLKTFERFKQGAASDYRIRYRTRPGMNQVAAQILELVARLFPEEFTAPDEYCRQHAAARRRAAFLLSRDLCQLQGNRRRRDLRPGPGAQARRRAQTGSHQRLPPGRPGADLRRDRAQPGRKDHLRPDLRPAPPPGRGRLPGPGQRRPAVGPPPLLTAFMGRGHQPGIRVIREPHRVMTSGYQRAR